MPDTVAISVYGISRFNLTVSARLSIQIIRIIKNPKYSGKEIIKCMFLYFFLSPPQAAFLDLQVSLTGIMILMAV